MAGVQLRSRHDRRRVVNAAVATTTSARVLHSRGGRQVSLIDVLDRLLQGGVVIQGQVILSAAEIDLVALDLRILIAAVDKLASR
jgi:Gas vesicle protein